MARKKKLQFGKPAPARTASKSEFERLSQAMVERSSALCSLARDVRSTLDRLQDDLEGETLTRLLQALDGLSRVEDEADELTGIAEELSETRPMDAEEIGQAAAYVEHLADPYKRHQWTHLDRERALYRVSDILTQALELAH